MRVLSTDRVMSTGFLHFFLGAVGMMYEFKSQFLGNESLCVVDYSRRIAAQ